MLPRIVHVPEPQADDRIVLVTVPNAADRIVWTVEVEVSGVCFRNEKAIWNQAVDDDVLRPAVANQQLTRGSVALRSSLSGSFDSEISTIAAFTNEQVDSCI